MPSCEEAPFQVVGFEDGGALLVEAVQTRQDFIKELIYDLYMKRFQRFHNLFILFCRDVGPS